MAVACVLRANLLSSRGTRLVASSNLVSRANSILGVGSKPSLGRNRSGTCFFCAQTRVNCPSQRMVDLLDSKQQRQASVFIDVLREWNQRMNLTAITDRCSMVERHIEDSLVLLPIIEDAYTKYSSNEGSSSLSLVDIGSGAGLPGVVLAIARPDWHVTLVESIRKRCEFLEHVIQESGLLNVKVLHMRAEYAGQDFCYRERYDVAVARAVAEMRILAEYCLPFVRVGGLFVAAKGFKPQEEIENAKKAIGLMGATFLRLCSVKSMGPHGQRTAALYFKKHRTPKRYPRNVGIPAKQPL